MTIDLLPEKLNQNTSFWFEGETSGTALTSQVSVSVKDEMAELCGSCFPIIKDKCPEMSDFELVEPMVAYVIVNWSYFVHMNFKAKHKNAADSTASMFFAEVDEFRKKAICCKIDPGSDCFQRCCYCESDDGTPSYAGHLYHPHTDKIGPWIGAC